MRAIGQSDLTNVNQKKKPLEPYLQNLNWNDFKNIGKIPCARSSFLYGIGGGATVGALRFLQKGQLDVGSYKIKIKCVK